ncbi:vomeronasal type-2 receptor 26-like [Podarcis muralis]
MVCRVHSAHFTTTNPVPIPHEWYEPGDPLIGGIASHIRYILPNFLFNIHPSEVLIDRPIVLSKFFQHILALVFAIDEINGDPKVLPNVTLGFHIYDSYYDAKMTYRTTLDLLFNSYTFVPNYKCGYQENVIGVIGGLSSEVTSCMADILGLYKIPQVGILWLSKN